MGIALGIFVGLFAISGIISFSYIKKYIHYKKQAEKWEQSYKNIKNLYDEVSEIRSEYEEKENNILPTGDSYNDILSDFAEGGKSKNAAKTKTYKNK